MSDDKKLTYDIRTAESNGWGGPQTRIEAVPSHFAARPVVDIEWPGPMNREMKVEVNWSSGGTTFDIEKARAFFNAGLALCDRAEQILAEPGSGDEEGKEVTK